MADNESRPLLSAKTAASVARAIKTWLNSCSDLATGDEFTFEDLAEDARGLTFTTDQAAVYAARYISGGYRGEYRFRLIYRVQPSDDADMLTAVEYLTGICAWCETAAPPDLDNAVNERIIRTSDVAVLAVYEDGCTDYSASLTFTWEEF